MSERLEIRAERGQELYAERSRAEPGWMVVIVARLVVDVLDAFDDLRELYGRVEHTAPVLTHDGRWCACGRVR